MKSSWRAVVVGSMLACASAFATAQDGYPTRPISLVVGYNAGGSVDLVARVVAPELSKRLGQQIVIENVGGAGGTLGAARVVKAEPDGYTLLLGSPSEVGINALTQKRPTYNALTDLAAVGMIGAQPLVLVTTERTGIKNAAEFRQYVAQRPGKPTYATSGIGTPLHLAGELIKREGGIDMLHIPYKGAGAMATDLLGGQVDFSVFVFSSALPHIREGRMKAVGVTSRERSKTAPEIPAMAETKPFEHVDIGVWFGLFAPARTPAPIVAKLQKALRETLRVPEVIDKLEKSGVTMTPDLNAQQYVRDEVDRFRKIIEFAKIEAQ